MMRVEHDVDLILSDCFAAMGQMMSTQRCVDYDAIVWLRNRYHEKFVRTVAAVPTAWPADRDRLLAVSRYLGLRAEHHAGDNGAIDAQCLYSATAEVEAGCRMTAARRAGEPQSL